MLSLLRSKYIVHEELTHEKMKVEVNEQEMYTSPILSKIQEEVGEILKTILHIQLSTGTISRSWALGYNIL